jgi:hypothetical protein
MEMNLTTPIFLAWNLKKTNDVTWDGTMGMPILPIADT